MSSGPGEEEWNGPPSAAPVPVPVLVLVLAWMDGETDDDEDEAAGLEEEDTACMDGGAAMVVNAEDECDVAICVCAFTWPCCRSMSVGSTPPQSNGKG